MKKLFLTFALVAFGFSTMAGETPSKPSFAGFVSNRFWDNWEISAGMGIGTALSNGTNLGSFGNRLGFEGNFAVTKWVHPVIGIRLQLQGGRFLNFDPIQGQMKWPYLAAHTDVMLNISNWIGGYRDDRAYYATPYVGFGYMASCFTDKFHRDYNTPTFQNFAFFYGLQNTFRISPAVDFNIDLKGMLVHAGISPVKTSGNYLLGFSATAGFTYRFNQRGWQRGVAGYTNEEISAFQRAVVSGNAAVAEANAANEQLVRELAEARAAADAARAASAQATAAEQKMVGCDAGTSVIFFRYGQAKLSDREQVRLDLIADHIKDTPKDQIFTIQGHADPETGSQAANDRLATKRAKVVFDYLVSKGVKPSRMSWEGLGTKNCPFKTSETNRVVVIK